MKKCLVATVGGSQQPIITAIRQEQPDLTVFLCSKPKGNAPGSDVAVRGEGKVCRSSPQGQTDLPNIPNQLSIPDYSWRVHEPLVDPDDFTDCYRVSRDLLETLRAENPQAEIQVDYTGGTKSMTAGLVAAALDCGFQTLQLVTGPRPDLKAVADGTESVRMVPVGFIHRRRQLNDADELLSKAEYSSAALVLEQCLKLSDSQSADWVQQNLRMATALDAWDRFEYREAFNLMEVLTGNDQLRDYLKQMLEGSDGQLSTLSMYLRCADLFENAQRRAEHRRYDDAVSRLYRCVELIAQARLKDKLGLDTKRTPVSEIPNTVDIDRTRHFLKLGLMLAWETLAGRLPEDGLAQIFTAGRGRLRDALQTRNDSYLAHGMVPVSEEDFRKQMEDGTGAFVKNCLRELLNEKTLPMPYPDWPRGLLPRPYSLARWAGKMLACGETNLSA